MKTKLTSALFIPVLFFTACNGGGTKNEHEGHDMNKDTSQHTTVADNKEIKTVVVTFSNVDPKAVASFNEMMNHYLHIKNALADDDGNDAAKGAKAMEKAIGSLDKSLLTTEQKKAYDDIEEELKEHAEHIGKNGDNIKHQREHFAPLSDVVYILAKSFGSDKPIYHAHCPMFNEEKGGAMWLSETQEIKNPFFGTQMPKCGTLEEVIGNNDQKQ